MTWTSDDPPDSHQIPVSGWIRVILRGIVLITLVFCGLFILLLIRLIERPAFGLGRPVTPYVTQFVCRNALRIIGITYQTSGKPMAGHGAIVANHSSWLDIFVLNARKRIYFVSKSEVASWPGIGWLARATGTVFIARNRKEAGTQVKVFQDRLNAGHKLLFFPEGTSTDGRRVLAFKPTLFAAFFAPELRETLSIQPVSVVYQAPNGMDPRFYGWWGDMDFGPHFLAVLAVQKHGSVHVVYHDPIPVSDCPNRKDMAAKAHNIIRHSVEQRLLGQNHSNAE
ncbi:lysophospholipid acyltransferase family protein [Aestuariibius sp. HNIBRBA575]|uniref:lysophospholipid acyltransferase family protein n=1 Tax=Aestuariibius sp. HNIBRBA575 TaxID=3233343 RepID=UPI0034A3098B